MNQTPRLVVCFLALLVLTPVIAGAQTNPCLAPLPPLSIIAATSGVGATLPDFTTTNLGGVTLWDTLDLSVFADGANPLTAIPVASVNMAKTAWTLTAGTTDCYRAAQTILFGVPADVRHEAYLRTRKGTVVSAWSTSLPFGRNGVAGPLPVPTGLRSLP